MNTAPKRTLDDGAPTFAACEAALASFPLFVGADEEAIAIVRRAAAGWDYSMGKLLHERGRATRSGLVLGAELTCAHIIYSAITNITHDPQHAQTLLDHIMPRITLQVSGTLVQGTAKDTLVFQAPGGRA